MLLKILLYNLVLTSGSSNEVSCTCVPVLTGWHHYDIPLINAGKLSKQNDDISNAVGTKGRNVRTDISKKLFPIESENDDAVRQPCMPLFMHWQLHQGDNATTHD